MAKILIVDDEALNRELLVSLLSSIEHHVLEATDGEEALKLTQSERPDLIISDVLMPTMDGYEFVRRLRADSRIKLIPVIFITGYYLSREARALATACGVSHIIYKPCAKEEVLRIVTTVLQVELPVEPLPVTNRDEFNREHMELLTDTLSENVDELTALNHKLAALIELSQKLASEHDPLNLLKEYSNLAREIIGAKWNAVGLINEDTQTLRQFYTVGLKSEHAEHISPQSLREGVFAIPLEEGRACRIRIQDGNVQAAGLPVNFPALTSCLSLPIMFRNKLYGTFCLGDKLGAIEFSEGDEHLAVTLVGQMAVAIENATLYRESQRRAVEMEEKAQLTVQVEQQRRRLDTIIANVPGVVWESWVEPDEAKQHFNFVSDYIETLVGYSVEEWLELPDFWTTIMHPDDRERATAMSAEHFITCDGYAQEFRWIARDGRTLWVEAQSSVICDAQGKAIGGRGVILDITERKRAEEAQRKSREQYESLVHSIDGIVWKKEAETARFTFVSQRSERLLGFAPAQWLAEPDFWSNHIHPEDQEWATSFSQDAIARKEDHEFDYRMIAADDRVVWLRDFVTVDATDTDHVMLQGVIVDISQDKREEAEREIIFEVIKGVTTTRNLEELLNLIHQSISRLLFADNCFVALHDPITGSMDFEFWIDQNDGKPPAHELRKGFSSYVTRMNRPLCLNNAIRKELFESGEVDKLENASTSWLGVPLRTPAGVIGVLVIQNYQVENAYSQRDLEFLTSVGDQIAVAIERKRSENENEKLLHDLGERVKELTALHCTALSLRSEESTTVDLLHEITAFLCAAYQYPEITAARIEVGDCFSETDNFVSTEWQQRTDFTMSDGQSGSIEINYLEARPDEAEGPFLLEERSMINSVAEMLRTGLERRRADVALRESEERYRDMVENARDIIYSHDLDGNYTSINRAAELITGYTREETLRMNVKQTLAPEAYEIARQMTAGKLAGDEQTVYDLELIAKDGTRITVEVSTRLTSQNGIPVGVQGIARDVTARKRAEQKTAQLTSQVEQQRQRLNTIIANVPGVVWETWGAPGSARQRVNFVSDYVETLLGYTVEEWLTTPSFWLSIVHPEDRDRAGSVSGTHFASGESYTQEFRWIAKDGHIVWVETQADVVRDAGGKSIGMRGVNIDITERKKAEEALRVSEEQLRQSHKLEAIGQLAGGVAHDFNNLLTVITGYSELTLRRLEKDSPIRTGIEEIKKAGERAASLTRQLLAFSRKQTLQPKVLELNSIVADVDKMLQRLIGEDIDLLTSLEPALGKVKADPGQIEQVIINLAVNARDAMPQGGKLTIETANIYLDSNYASNHIAILQGHYVMLAVSDTGCGMDAEIQARIFDPFFTTKESGKGTGLGLSTVYGIVKQSGGNVWVYSEVGIGTTFKIYLPRLEHTVTSDWAGEVQNALPRGYETVLLVEDEEQVRIMTRGILEMNGHRVFEASNGEDALDIFKEHEDEIGLVLSDAVMPQMSGRVLVENVRRLCPDVRVLYMSGYTDDAIVRHGLLDQKINFLQKPFTPDALMRKVREVLDKPRQDIDVHPSDDTLVTNRL